MHYCLGKRDIYGLRERLIEVIKNQVKHISNLDMAKNAKLASRIVSWVQAFGEVVQIPFERPQAHEKPTR